MNRKSKTIAVSFVIAGMAAAPFAFAQGNAEPKKPAETQGMQEMMQSEGMGMMSQMNEMMSTCNKMMQTMMPGMPSEKGKQPDKG